MTKRESILAVMRGQKLANPPVSIRLDLWHTSVLQDGTLPAELKGKTLPEIESGLGFAVTSRFRNFFRIQFQEGVKVKKNTENETTTEEISYAGRSATKISRLTGEMKQAGMLPHTVKYPIETEEDYRFVIELLENARIVTDPESYRAFDLATGDSGLPILIIGPCPAHEAALEYLGYENFFIHMYDLPDLLDKFIAAIDRLYRRDLWPQIASSAAIAILHGAHFSSAMTPPPIFDRYFKPYFRDFISAMQKHGKLVGFHADAEMEELLAGVLEIGFNFSDCLASEPLVKTPLEKYYEAWHGKIALWGGLPSIIFDASFAFDKFKEHVDKIVAMGREKGGLIIGASDNVMPGAEWRRILYIAEAVRENR